MFDRLKKALARRKHGPELADLIECTEASLLAMPPDLRPTEWVRWLWNLPPDAWTEAIDLKRRASNLHAEREAAIRAITVRARLTTTTNNPLEAEDAARQAAAEKEEWQRREVELQERKRQFAKQYGNAP